ncbi:hypothetical protein B6N13_09370 [Marinomonas sp. UCMA 3892]|nr:hypothetical protein [Marinomonas sp. UCMA 3892]
MHAYPPKLPKQVHLRCVLLTSYRFLQTLPLASNALAIRILFPPVGVRQVSYNLTGLPASLGKQKNGLTLNVSARFFTTSNRFNLADFS